MKMTAFENEVKRKLLAALRKQGFKVGSRAVPNGSSKSIYKKIQLQARLEQIAKHKNFLLGNFEKIKKYCRDGSEINPAKISLELREVATDSLEEVLYRWWNFIWWSIPFQRSYGRQMRFLLWDKTHNSIFGLICLQSPVLKMAVRDEYLQIPNDELDVWVNRSLNAQRVGALPPYNDLLGGKMVALSLTCNEIRKAYHQKYKEYISIIKERRIPPNLLFITTTSAFGKSSLYNRLKYGGELVAKPLGFTQGAGSFHIPESNYEDIVTLLKKKGVDAGREFGHGPSRKLKLITLGLKYLNLPKFQYHGIKREFYLFSLVKNLQEVISDNKSPQYYDRPFNKLAEYWEGRWAIPRSHRCLDWKQFSKKVFFKNAEKICRGK